MKLYTEEQLLEICKSVAEKACANTLEDDWIKRQCGEYSHYSKLEINASEDIIDYDSDVVMKVMVVK